MPRFAPVCPGLPRFVPRRERVNPHFYIDLDSQLAGVSRAGKLRNKPIQVILRTIAETRCAPICPGLPRFVSC